MQVAYVEYTGDGNDDRVLNGAGFAPDMALCVTATRFPFWRTDDMPVNTSQWLGPAFAGRVDCIKTLTADGCTLGTRADVNANGASYAMLFFRDNGAGDFAIGTYTGNGVDDRNIPCVGCPTPALVWVKGDGVGSEGVFRDIEDDAGKCHTWTNEPDGINRIQAFGVGNFQIGTDADVSTVDREYYFAAFAASAILEIGAYAGNGVDDRDIATALDADLVVVKVESGVPPPTQDTPFRTPDRVGTEGVSCVNDTASTDNVIEEMDADSFQVGTHLRVNDEDYDYHWFAFAAGETGGNGGNGNGDDGDGVLSGGMRRKRLLNCRIV